MEVVAIVTGGARGFGRAFAEEILSRHGKVMITDINAHDLQATGKELQHQYGKQNVFWGIQDVMDKESFVRVFSDASDYFKRPVNLLVNNAGIAGNRSFYEPNSTNWKTVLDVDLTALISGTKVAIDEFKRTLKGNEGVIVNISSMAGLNALPFAPEYAAAKAGVVGFTRSLYELKKTDNIRCFCLCPGFAETQMGYQAHQELPELTESMGGLLPVKAVVDAFAAALREPDNAGRVIRILKTSTGYHRFPGDKVLFPNSKL